LRLDKILKTVPQSRDSGAYLEDKQCRAIVVDQL
jgi:hypothetical protein